MEFKHSAINEVFFFRQARVGIQPAARVSWPWAPLAACIRRMPGMVAALIYKTSSIAAKSASHNPTLVRPTPAGWKPAVRPAPAPAGWKVGGTPPPLPVGNRRYTPTPIGWKTGGTPRPWQRVSCVRRS